MKISIFRDTGFMSVDGVSRKVNTSVLPEAIEAVFFDTVAEMGWIQFQEGATQQVEFRDLEAEKAENERRRINNLPPLETTIKGTRIIKRPPRPLTSFDQFQPLMLEWEEKGLPEIPSQEQVEEEQRGQAVDQAISQFQLGNSSPATIAQLKKMTVAQYNAWFDANFTSAAQLIGLLKRMLLVIIRRLL